MDYVLPGPGAICMSRTHHEDVASKGCCMLNNWVWNQLKHGNGHVSNVV